MFCNCVGCLGGPPDAVPRYLRQGGRGYQESHEQVLPDLGRYGGGVEWDGVNAMGRGICTPRSFVRLYVQ